MFCLIDDEAPDSGRFHEYPETHLADSPAVLFAITLAQAADDGSEWVPTPPRLSFIDGEVSYWRQGADDWVRAVPNLALAEGDALYTGGNANFEVQFGSRSFVRADETSQLSSLQQRERLIQVKVARSGCRSTCAPWSRASRWR